MADNLPSFGWGGTGQGMSDADFSSALFSQSLPFLDTLGTAVTSGAATSLGLGTVIRESELPAPAPTTQAVVAGDTVLPSTTITGRRLPEAYYRANAAKGFREEASEELQQRRDDAGAITEEQYKAAPYFRPDIPYSPQMTAARAQAQAEIRDRQRVREFFMEKRPITAFIGQLAGGALDPTNYIPVAGPAVRAAAIARAGRVIGTAVTTAGEAAIAQGVIGAMTAPERQQFGDDVSWQAQVTDIAMGALTGGIVGGVVGRVGRHFDLKAERLENQMKARAVLDDAVTGVAEGRGVDLTPTSGGMLDDVAQERAALVDAYDRVRADPNGPVREPLIAIRPDEIEGMIVARGAFKDVNEVEFSRRGWGLVKIVWRHGEESNTPPEFQIRKEDITALPDVVREYEPSSVSADGLRREWRVDRDGRTVVYADSMMGDDGRHLVTAYVPRGSDNNPPLSVRRGAARLPGSTPPAGNREGDTGAGLSIGDRAAGQVATPSSSEVSSPLGDTTGALNSRDIQGRPVNARARASVDISSPAPQIDPARIKQAAKAEAAVGKPETSDAFAKDVGFHPETGESIVSPLVKQIEAEGRLTPEASAEIKAATDGIEDANAYVEALRVATGCII